MTCLSILITSKLHRRDDIVSKECLLSDSENRYQEQRGEIDHLVAKLLSKIKEREGEVLALKYLILMLLIY